MNHSSLCPLLVYKRPLQEWETWHLLSIIHLFGCSFPVLTDNGSELLTCTPWEQLRCLDDSLFHLDSYRPHSFPQVLRSASLCPHSKVCHAFLVVRFFGHLLHFITGSSKFLLFFICTHEPSLRPYVLWVLTNTGSCIQHYSITRNTSTSLNQQPQWQDMQERHRSPRKELPLPRLEHSEQQLK